MTKVVFPFFVGLWENHFGLANFFLSIYPSSYSILILYLDEALLGVAIMFREELVVMPHDEDYNRSNRFAAYRQYTNFLMTKVVFPFFVGLWENHFGLANFFLSIYPSSYSILILYGFFLKKNF
jgi:hypothetical protein